MAIVSHKAIAATGLRVIEEVILSTPTPSVDEVLVDMKYAAFSPVDAYQVDEGYHLEESNYPHVLGFAGAGIVKSIGENVDGIKAGDRVTAFTYGESRTKPLQKYCIVPKTLLAKVPDSFPLEDAASMSNSFVTAMHTLFSSFVLTLPLPSAFPSSSPTNGNTPILVYGGSTSSGQYIIQLLKLSGYTNIITTASPKHHELLTSLGAKACVDYHSLNFAKGIVEGAEGRKVEIVIDCIAARPSIEAYASSVSKGGRVAVLMPVKDGANINNGNGSQSQMHLDFPLWMRETLAMAELLPVYAFKNQADPIGKNTFMPKILPQLLEDGLLKPTSLVVMNEGSMLERAKEALDLLRNNQLSGKKVLVKIDY